MYKNNSRMYSFFIIITIIIGLIAIYYRFGKISETTNESFTLPPMPPFIIISDDDSAAVVTAKVANVHNTYSSDQSNMLKDLDLALSQIDTYIMRVDDRLRREMHIVNKYDNENGTNNLRIIKNTASRLQNRLKNTRDKIDTAFDKTLHTISYVLDM